MIGEGSIENTESPIGMTQADTKEMSLTIEDSKDPLPQVGLISHTFEQDHLRLNNSTGSNK